MKIKTTTLAVLSAVVVAIGVTTVVLINKPAAQDKTADTNQSVQSAQDTQGNPNLVSFTAVAGKSVLDQTREHATVETKDSQYGEYVDSINGKKGGEGNKYWSYYVNGELAQIGAAEYMPKGGETVQWKFE